MEAAMGLMRRIHPKQSDTALSALLSFCLTTPPISSPKSISLFRFLYYSSFFFFLLCDVDCGKEFILCEYNRDADSYRSPWSNKYHPPLEDALFPSSDLRKLEIEANDVFAVYRDQYYEGGISSVYMWEDDNEGFGMAEGLPARGAWDAIHVIQVGPEEEGVAHYCLTSTIMLSLTTNDESSGTFSLSGSIRRQMNMDLPISDGHLCNMGKMIEEMEGKLRNSLDQVYFGKTKEMVCTLPPSEIVMRLPDS
ncbi:hypothetical protein K2173_022177 [Erythroxylum novogranatense]|uniref:F-actin-capping protein subunit beta n=1 Tax=Erythroxylum novogranatense TaxID=1862640 RepID=A0AAV8TVR6_9ROSI|nr:hypothetical protein K2173_022177 [Erythroxylum novogranatense]